jgi:hypothetical protein
MLKITLRLAFTLLITMPVMMAGPLGLTAPLSAQPVQSRLQVAGVKETDVKLFLKLIQQAVRQDDAANLAVLVSYPIKISDGQGQAIEIADAKAFVANYAKFTNANWKKAVIKQKYSDLFANAKGVMVGKGEIWFAGICKDPACQRSRLKIIGINPVTN